jgi:hypothetical protein
MADIRVQTYSSSNCYYDVFLSFRGKDTRKSFIDHLYAALKGQGFLVFRDENEAEKGENLKSELEKAIGQAKSSILGLSNHYAASPWCVDELVMILDRMKNSERIRLNDPTHWKHEVLPVFYDVKPSHLRKQTRMIAESFAVYEKQIESETDLYKKTDLIDKVKRWRSALTEVSDLIGLELRNHDGGSSALTALFYFCQIDRY